jgi:hypothetical protein
MGSAAALQAPVEVGAQRCRRHLAQVREQQFLRIAVEGGIDGLLDEARRCLRPQNSR